MTGLMINLMTCLMNRLRLFTIFALFSVIPLTVQARTMDDYPRVKLQSLDKITARTMTFEAKVGDTVKFGPLFIKVQACREAPPVEQPESAAFMQIWEITPEDKSEWIFSGWMFASSPGLSSMDHPIYDVWVLDCLGETEHVDTAEEAKPEEEKPVPEEEPVEEAESDDAGGN